MAIYSKKRLVNLVQIGQGSFGTVFRADLKTNREATIQVAVKCFCYNNLAAILKERKRMENLDHPNIVRLIGTTAYNNGQMPWLIMEYMPFGDLWYHINQERALTASVMVKFAYGIACGMAYLHHEVIRKHGDLAARNCLVGHNSSIKIGDFGRFDTDYEDMYYNYDYDGGFDLTCPCPVRWMPPENLPENNDGQPLVTRKGDVWAYGVVLFEIWTRSSIPYEDLSNYGVTNALLSGENPKVYKNVPARPYISRLMDECWEQEPSGRPNFKYIKKQFEEHDPNIVGN